MYIDVNRSDISALSENVARQEADLNILKDRLDTNTLKKQLVGDEFSAWLKEHLAEVVAAQALAGSVDVKMVLRRLLAPPLLTFTTPKLTENAKPSTLLKSTYEVVPFAGREDELDDLSTWCEADVGFAVRLYVGAGGIGKTRLMRELCKWRQVDGWQVGFLVNKIPDGADITLLPDPNRPTLLVIDYAETRTDVLSKLINELEQ